MRVECPSCHFSANVSAEKMPPSGGNAKCPQCSAVFFVAPVGSATPAELLPSEELSPKITCPKCGLVQDRDESCAQCGIIYSKFRKAVDRVQPAGPEPTSPEATESAGPLDLFQLVLLLTGAIAVVYSIVRSSDLAHLNAKYFAKPATMFELIIGTFNKYMAGILVFSGTAEGLLLIFALYSNNKRRFGSRQTQETSLEGDRAKRIMAHCSRKSMKYAVTRMALALLISAAIMTALSVLFDHSEGSFGVPVYCIFVGLLVLVAAGIGSVLGKVESKGMVVLLTGVAVMIEVAALKMLKPFLIGSHESGLLWIYQIKMLIYTKLPFAILAFASYELFMTLRKRQVT